MKMIERKEAIRLRKDEGLSLGEIARKLSVSKGTVSIWTQGIKLTDEQKRRLEYNFKVKNSYESRMAGSNAVRYNAEVRRIEWQEQGKKEAKKKSWLHIAGCMLYWAEGWKRNNKNQVSFCNSELPMLALFLKFLRECFGVKDDNIAVSINCYTDIHPMEEIEGYWLKGLGLPRTCLRKTMADRRPMCTQKKVNGTLPYGTCRIVVCDVSIVQKIYGAIQEYGDFEKQNW